MGNGGLRTERGGAMKLRIKFRRKLFHYDKAWPLGSVVVTVNGPAVRFGRFNLEPEYEVCLIAIHRDVIRRHVMEYRKDSKHQIFWDPESGWESEISEACE